MFRLRIGAVLLVMGAALHAQSGFVRSGGQPVPGATVTATDGDRQTVTTTGESGHYAFPQLASGPCAVEVRMFGFETVRQEVDYSKTQQVDFSLQLLRFSARTARTAANGDQATAFEAQIQRALTTGQAPAANGTPASTETNEAFLVSGSLSQGLAPNATPDFAGMPPPPMMGGRGMLPGNNGEPVRMQAQGPGGDGPAAGGPRGGFGGPGGPGGGPGGPGGGPGGFGGPGRVVMRRDGPLAGRQFGNRRPPSAVHGMAFFNLNNSAFNAKPFSITGQDVSQPAYAQSRFGFMLGGPLAIPKIGKDRATFFFLNYTGTRARNPFTAVATVPSDLERAGNFSQSVQAAGGPVQIYDPTNGLPYAGNVIPDTAINPIARQLLNFVPRANQPGSVNNYQFLASVPQNSDSFAVRLMRSFGKNDRLAGHMSLQRRDGDTAQTFGFLDTVSGSGLATDLAWTHNVTPRMINNVRVTFNRNRNETTPFFAFGTDAAKDLGIAGTSTNPANFGPPNLNFTNFGALSDGNPSLTRNQNQSAGESLIVSRGVHTITLGFQFARNDLNSLTDPNGRGTLNFTGLATSALGPGGLPLAGSGFDFADFLLGLPQSSSIRYSGTSLYFRQNVLSGFGQDDWKVTPSLTLSAGLRYEYFSPFTEKYGRMANLDLAPGYLAAAVVIPGALGPYSGEFPAGLINPDRNNFSPRIGLAWKVPFGKRSTIVRTGYGIYYNGQAYNSFSMRFAQQPPFAVANNINTSAGNILTIADAFIATAPGEVTNTYAVDRNYRTPYAQTWTLSIQHELSRGFFVEGAYLGTKGTRLDILTVPNQGPSALPGRTGNTAGYTLASSNGNSIYHALQARATQRFRRGFSVGAFYTFSKSIDNSSTFGGVGNTVAQNWLDLGAERGLSSFDHRHSFDVNWVLTSPVGLAGSSLSPYGWGARLLKDWQLSGSITAQSGAPFTARVLGNAAQLAVTGGTGSKRADATGASVTGGTGFFNPAAFAVPAQDAFGNAGRNTIPGPGLFSLNLAFGRSFPLGESRRRVELRVEGTNVLNQVSYSSINTVVNASNYGLPVAAESMRQIDVVARFRF